MAADPSSASAVHPDWKQPTLSGSIPQLAINNSLTGTKTPFITIDPLQKHVKWYICGPTVYDSAHLGHARAYVTFDIIRRIMQRYFGFDVSYVMNITDIDDKIILRARQDFLFRRYCEGLVKQGPDGLATLRTDLKAAAKKLIESAQQNVEALEMELSKAASGAQKDLTGRLEEAKLKYAKAEEEVKSASEDASKLSGSALRSVEIALAQTAAIKNVLAPHVDRQHAHEAQDQSIFQAHARRFEQEFMEDMRALGVQAPSAIVRVTEYVPEIVKYVQTIIDNGYAYESNGSVYFDTRAFNKDHDYAKLSPQSRGNLVALNDGEGALENGTDKRHPTDFALWKKSKPGEPRWNSPWSVGRPGWHIECSVMASAHFGDKMDIHSGGVDLKFPHHDNELAQAEAHFKCQQWVNFFMHAGHLYIKDCKMSKSLKNFITIRAVLQRHSATQVRLLFLLQPWDQLMNYDESAMGEAAAKDKLFREFFLNIRAQVRRLESNPTRSQTFSPQDRELKSSLDTVRCEVHSYLADNFNYPASLRALETLVSKTNKYISSSVSPHSLLLRDVAKYINDMLCVFGVGSEEQLGFGKEMKEDESKVLRPIVDVLVSFQEAIAKAVSNRAKPEDILRLCDELRDDILPQHGVRLEDLKDQAAQWKLVDAQELMSELQAKKDNEAKEKARKASKAQEMKLKQLDKLLEGRESPHTRFEREGFKQFDANGIPTHSPDGEELKKNAVKKLKKQLETRKKEHDKYLAALDTLGKELEQRASETGL